MTQQTQINKSEYPQVSELCDFRKGKKVNSTKEKTKDSVPYLLIDTLRGADPEFFTEDKNYTEAIPEDILIVADGANSGLVGTGVSGAVGSTILRIRLKVKDLDKDYLSYFLKSKFEEFNKDMKGTGIPHLKPKNMLESKIRKPSLPEQTLIVQEIEKQFTRLDASVKSLKSVKKKLEVYRKAVLKKAFEKKDGWEEKKFGECVRMSRNGYTGRPRESLPGIPRLGIETITKSKSLYVDEKYVKFIDIPSEKIGNYQIEKGNLMVCRQNGNKHFVGKFSVYNGKTNPLIFSDSLIKFIINESEILPEYAAYFMNSDFGRSDIDNRCSTTAGNYSINSASIKNVKIYFPSTKEQTQIVQEIESKFSVIDKIEQVVEASLTKTEKLRKSILKSAFEGKLVKMEEVEK